MAFLARKDRAMKVVTKIVTRVEFKIAEHTYKAFSVVKGSKFLRDVVDTLPGSWIDEDDIHIIRGMALSDKQLGGTLLRLKLVFWTSDGRKHPAMESRLLPSYANPGTNEWSDRIFGLTELVAPDELIVRRVS